MPPGTTGDENGHIRAQHAAPVPWQNVFEEVMSVAHRATHRWPRQVGESGFPDLSGAYSR